jgi:hypothetical protein
MARVAHHHPRVPRLADVPLKPVAARVPPWRARARKASTPETLPGRIRAEFEEMPGTCLTLAQASRLFQLAPDACVCILGRLVDEGVLRLTLDGRYRLRSFGA